MKRIYIKPISETITLYPETMLAVSRFDYDTTNENAVSEGWSRKQSHPIWGDMNEE